MAAEIMTDGEVRSQILDYAEMLSKDDVNRLGVPIGDAWSLEIDGEAAYPALQFDTDNTSVFPVVQDILAKLPEHWSHLHLLYWFMQEHYDFDGPPADAFASDPEGVMAAFMRASLRPTHG